MVGWRGVVAMKCVAKNHLIICHVTNLCTAFMHVQYSSVHPETARCREILLLLADGSASNYATSSQFKTHLSAEMDDATIAGQVCGIGNETWFALSYCLIQKLAVDR